MTDAPAVRLGAWNYYFLAKFVLVWRELIGFHPLENLAFAAALLAPIRSPRLRLVRNVAAVPVAIALLYHDTWLPAISRVLSQASLVASFSPSYLAELAGRFVSWPAVASLALAWAACALTARFLRVGVAVVAIMIGMTLFHGSARTPSVVPTASAQAADPDAALRAFYAAESKRRVRFAPPPDGAPPFDLFFIHICSLSWDDLEATGMSSHPLWQEFDILFKRFNSATPYSGPAAIRLLRAPCGQQRHALLYAPVPDDCLLMPTLRQAGFETGIAFNHDGHFDDFLGFVREQGIPQAPMSLDGLAPAMRAFDDTAIQGDAAVLSRWLERRQKSDAPHVATYYNTISLHDGNRFVGAPVHPGLEGYKLRLTKLLDDIENFIRQMERSGRRAVIVVIPEHGAAIRGDRMQIAGLREIPTPAITLIPVGIKVIGPDAHRIGEPVRIDTPASYLGMSYIVSHMLEKPPFGAAGFTPGDYTADMPSTGYVAENGDTVMMKYGAGYLLRQGAKEPWRDYAVDEPH